MPEPDYTVLRYPSVRQFTMDVGRIGREKHFVRTLLEIDVTVALQKIKALRRPGRKISFLAWFIHVLAETVAQHPPVNGIRQGRNAVLVFHSVDVSTVVEKMVEGKPVPLPLVLRGANHKTPYVINEEIQSAVGQAVTHPGNLVLGKGEDPLLLRLAAAMPQWLRLLVMRAWIFNNPRRMQQMMGTVMVTSLGTVGRLSGWILPSSMHPLSIGIGSLNKKELVFQGEVQVRSILHLTIAIDHDVVDGMPALRFVNDLVYRLETGAGLEE